MKIAREGAWVELDGVNENSIEQNVKMIKEMIGAGLLNRTLISHDYSWYLVGEEKGGQTANKIRLFDAIADKLVPALKKAEVGDAQIQQLITKNPAKAFTVQIKPLNVLKP